MLYQQPPPSPSSPVPANSLCVATHALAPYFYCGGLIRAAKVDAPCMWDQMIPSTAAATTAAAVSSKGRQTNGHYHPRQKQQTPTPTPPYALRTRRKQAAVAPTINGDGDDDDDNTDGIEEAPLLDEDRFFYPTVGADATTTTTAHCTHYVTIVDSINRHMVGRRVRVPGVVLMRFMDRLLCDLNTRLHLDTHCGRMAALSSDSVQLLSTVMEAALGGTTTATATIGTAGRHGWRAMEALFLAMPPIQEFVQQQWLIDEASYVGRYAQPMFGGSCGAAVALKGPVETQGHRMYIVDESTRQRIMLNVRFEFEHTALMSGGGGLAMAAVIEDRDPAQRDALIALLGVSNFQQDFNPANDVRLFLSAAATTASASTTSTTTIAVTTVATATATAAGPLLSDMELSRAQQSLGLRSATACHVCQENVAQICVLPCRHVALCIACAIRTYDLRGDFLLPNGTPRLRPSAKCTTCHQLARTCCRLFGLASR